MIDFVLDNDPAYDMVGVAITNNGRAPALINSISFYVDSNLVAGTDAVAERGKLAPDLIRSGGLRAGNSLGVGTTRYLFAHSTKSDRDLDRFIEFINYRLSVHVVFCSLNGECWETCSSKGRC